MNKLFDWPTRLNKYFDECAFKEFEYGVFDCALFVADGIQAMTGVDILSKYRGKYRNEEEAKFLIIHFDLSSDLPLQASFDKIINFIADEYKFKNVTKNFVPRGGIVLMDEMFSNSLGLVDLSGRAIICPHPEHGLLSVPLNHGYKFWSID